MKKVININFQGRVVPIEETSLELLKQYTDSLRSYFNKEEGRDEIINDIESRIAELFQERLKTGATCITDEDVNTIINNMGRPKDFADADDTQDSQQSFADSKPGAQSQSTTQQTSRRLYRDQQGKILGGVCSGIAAYFNIEPILVRLVFVFSGIGLLAYLILWVLLPSSDNVQNHVRKRLYRNPDDKIIAGVCSGIASYFNINVWIPRVLFLIPFISILFRWGHLGPLSFPSFIHFSYSPGTFIIYVILWLVIPEANTTSEKLEMKGEKVDLNSIKNSVVEEMKEVRERIGKLAKDAGKYGEEKSAIIGTEMAHVAKRSRSGLGDFLVLMVKIFVYFILGIFACMCFGFAIAATGLFPFKDYILNDGVDNWLAWGTLIFLIYVPVIGIITWIIRRLAKIKSNSKTMRFGFLTLWIVGLFCFIALLLSLQKNFRSRNNIVTETINLSNAKPGKLTVIGMGNNFRSFRIVPFAGIDDDTAYVNNVTVRIVKSPNDSFQVSLSKFCNGSTRSAANTQAAAIQFNVEERDSTLYVDKGIRFTPQDKFRNQHVVVTIAVPVGKAIRLNGNMNSGNWERFEFGMSDSYYENDWGTKEYNWGGHADEDLVMKEEGLFTSDGDPVDVPGLHKRSRRNQNMDDPIIPPPPPPPGSGIYHYDQPKGKTDSLKQLKNKVVQQLNDSIQKIKDLYDRKIQNADETTPREENAFMRYDRNGFDVVLVI